jgi:DHA1 family tetracycline resistance protein-like MFS transporter
LHNGNAIVFVLVTVALDSIGLGIIIPVLPDLVQEVAEVDLAKAAQWGGVLAASYAVTQFLFGPLLGSLSDRYGRRPVLLLGLIALSIDYVIMGFAHTIWLLLLGRLLAGAAGSTYATANAFVADVSAPENRAANFGMIGAAFGVGFILGPVIGGLLGALGTRAPFFAAAGLALLNAGYGYLVLPESLSAEHRRAFSWHKSNPLSGLLLIKRFPTLGWVFLAMFLFGVGHFVYPSIWAYWGIELFDWSTVDIGITLAMVGLGFAVVQGGLIRIVIPKLGEARTALFSYAVTLLGLLIFSFTSSNWIVYASLPVIALGGMVNPAITGILANAIPENEQGLLQGVLSGIAAIATIVSPLLMTNLFFAFSGDDTPFYFPGAPYLAAFLLCTLSMIAFSIGVGKSRNLDLSRSTK